MKKLTFFVIAALLIAVTANAEAPSPAPTLTPEEVSASVAQLVAKIAEIRARKINNKTPEVLVSEVLARQQAAIANRNSNDTNSNAIKAEQAQRSTMYQTQEDQLSRFT